MSTERRTPPAIPTSSDRQPVSADVWDRITTDTWRDTVWQLMEDVITNRVQRAILRSPPEYVVSDDLSWLDDIVWSVSKRRISTKELLTDRLRTRYRALRAVHGTRTADLASFYERGLSVLDPEVMHARARSIFLSGEFSELSEAALDDAIRAVGPDLREGRLYFETNEAFLLEHCGHYLLYGSEYLTAIAAHLKGYRDYRQVLKRIGEPTMLVCDVPLKLISNGALEEFAGMALETLFQELLDQPEDRNMGGGLCLFAPLPASSIVGHYHPARIRDPLLR